MPYALLNYHLIWHTKFSRPMITENIEHRIHGAIRAKAISLGGKVYRIGGIEDHVHVLTTIPPSISVSSFVGQIKGNSAHFTNTVLGLNEPFVWQRSFGAITFRYAELERLIQYVKRQRAHHRNKHPLEYLEAHELESRLQISD
jgi:putative transposase